MSCSCGRPKVKVGYELSASGDRKPEKPATIVVQTVGEVIGEPTDAQREPGR
jgi:hypothetical protein